MLQLLQMIGSGSAKKLYADDVFSTYLYTGNGSTQTINNGIDLAGKGGLVWTKTRQDVAGVGSTITTNIQHFLRDTARGASKWLVTNSLSAETTSATGAFTSTGYTITTGQSEINANTNTYASWTFRNAPKFHAHDVVTKSAGSNATISFPELETLGMVRVKRTDAAGSWYVWHRSLSAGQLLIGETTAAAAMLGHITVSGTTVTLVNGVIANGTYLVEAFAHDPSADGLIQCGSFTADSSGNATVNLGFEPQYFLRKESSGANDWVIFDTMRGWSMGSDAFLYPHKSSVELTGDRGNPTATGFTITDQTAYATYIYLVIPRSRKPPTTGAEVYNAVTAYASSTPTTLTLDVGVVGDGGWTWNRDNSNSIYRGEAGFTRLTGNKYLVASSTNAEGNADEGFYGVVKQTDFIRSYGVGNIVEHVFRRAAGFYDIVCYNGTGSNKTEPHTLLGVAPELWRAKRRNSSGSWVYGSSLLNANEKILMPSPAGRVTDATVWNSTYPTATQFSLGTHADVNAAGGTYIMEMWSTLAGVSKAGTYTGNGSTQTIDCGFGTGARFVKIIRMTAGVAQDIFIWDTARGIVAANDPHLSLNATAAEVTTDDSLNPHPSGFIVLQNAATNINVLNATYLFLSIS